MTLKHLNIFSEVCQAESITKAAEKLNMAQPAVSNAIRELESYYGVKLFDRLNRRIYITEAGQTLLKYADSILLQFAESKTILRDNGAFTEIRIGSNVAFGTDYLPRIASEFEALYPEIPLRLSIFGSARIKEAILHNQLDFAIVDNIAETDELHCLPLASDEMTALCSPNFPFLSKQKAKQPSPPETEAADVPDADKRTTALFSITDLNGVPLLLREPGSGSRDLLDRLFHHEKLSPVIAAESSSTQALIELALRGHGVIFLSSTSAKFYADAGLLIALPLDSRELTRNYSLVYHRQKYLTESMKCFLGYMTRAFPQI
ncbi:MAG: LysR family transcriptional regulator [Lachnospiraceae bacterium]|nr:LysR family transcriptional regulator [Lachnospiraceae bacterium]